jgi:hypothetical protein
MATIINFGVPQLSGGGSDSPILMPKLVYRFRVTLFNFGGAAATSTLTSQVVSVTKPNLTHDEITVDVYNSKIFLAGKHTWDPITLTVKDDISGNVDRNIAAQLQRQLNHAAQSAPVAGANYKFAMRIEALDGGNNVNQQGDTPIVLDQWDLAGCFLQNVQYGENNYATSDVVNITMQIRYDNADHTVNGVSQLSRTPNRANGLATATANGANV